MLTRESQVTPTPSQAASHAESPPVGSGDLATHSEEEPVCLCLLGEQMGSPHTPKHPRMLPPGRAPVISVATAASGQNPQDLGASPSSPCEP